MKGTGLETSWILIQGESTWIWYQVLSDSHNGVSLSDKQKVKINLKKYLKLKITNPAKAASILIKLGGTVLYHQDNFGKSQFFKKKNLKFFSTFLIFLGI